MQDPAKTQGSEAAYTLEAVRSSVQSVIGIIPADDRPLTECGLDSLGAVELRNSLASRFSMAELPATLTYDYPTVNAVASFIAGAKVHSAALLP